MEVIVRINADDAAELTSRLIEARLRAKPELVLGMATGRTMERVYDKLVAKHQSEGLDFSRCRTFNRTSILAYLPRTNIPTAIT